MKVARESPIERALIPNLFTALPPVKGSPFPSSAPLRNKEKILE
jgi:hypothetical protein